MARLLQPKARSSADPGALTQLCSQRMPHPRRRDPQFSATPGLPPRTHLGRESEHATGIPPHGRRRESNPGARFHVKRPTQQRCVPGCRKGPTKNVGRLTIINQGKARALRPHQRPLCTRRLSHNSSPGSRSPLDHELLWEHLPKARRARSLANGGDTTHSGSPPTPLTQNSKPAGQHRNATAPHLPMALTRTTE